MDIKGFIKDSVRYTRIMDLRVYGMLSVLSIIASLLLIITGVTANNDITLIVYGVMFIIFSILSIRRFIKAYVRKV